jgi:hypothetical protein
MWSGFNGSGMADFPCDLATSSMLIIIDRGENRGFVCLI